MRIPTLGTGLMLSFTLGQGQWQNAHFPVSGDVPALLAIGSELYAASSGRGVYRSPDNGDTWVSSDSGLTDPYVQCLASSGPDLFAGTLSGLFISSDQGATWRPSDSGMPVKSEIHALAVSGTDLFAGTYASGIFRSSDKGRIWTRMDSASPVLSLRAFLVTGTGLFAAATNGIYRSTDRGLHWNAINAGLDETFAESLAAIGSRLFAGTSGGAYLSTDNGDHWTKASAGLSSAYAAVPGLLPVGENLIAGTPIGVYESGNYGGSWASISSGFATVDYIQSLAANSSFLFASVSNSTSDNGVWRMTAPTTGITSRSGLPASQGSQVTLRKGLGAYSVLGRRADLLPLK